MEDFEEEQASDEEEDKVVDRSSATIVGYSSIIREISLTCNVHVLIARQSIT